MNKISLATPIKSIMAVSIASVLLLADCDAQTFEINNNRTSGHGFRTTEGTITALHVGGIKFNRIFQQIDIGIDTGSKHASGFKTSDLPPSYFIDRRGRRHDLSKVGKFGLQTTVSLRFYPGESGMPVFAKDGTVCGVVLGNAFRDRKWLGRIARISLLLEDHE